MAANDPLSHFQDREGAIAAFDSLWDGSTYWLLAFVGFSGHGKSTLIRWLEVNRCKRDGIPYVEINFKAEKDYDQVLTDVIRGLRQHLPAFTYRVYRNKREAILEDLTRLNDSIHINQSQVEGEANIQSVNLDLDKARQSANQHARRRLTQVWLDCLERFQGTNLVLLFDTFENFEQSASRPEQDWFWSTLEAAHKALPGLRVIIGSRQPVKGPEWGVYQEELQAFSADHSEALLVSLGVRDSSYRQAVYDKLAHGHPLVTRFAAEVWLEGAAIGCNLMAGDVPRAADLERAIEWVHGKILDQLREPLKSVIRWAALLRTFNVDVLEAVLNVKLTPDDFRRLISYSFIVHDRQKMGWACHTLLRRVLCGYLRRERPAEFETVQCKAAVYFAALAPMEALYHRFFFDLDGAFEEWRIRESAVATRYDHSAWEELLTLVEGDEVSLAGRYQAEVLMCIGKREQFTGDFLAAKTHYERARAIYQDISDRLGEAYCIFNLGDAHNLLAEYKTARACYEEARTVCHDIGYRRGKADCIQRLGNVLMILGEYETAWTHYDEARSIHQDIGDRLGEANCLGGLGDVHFKRGEYEAAQRQYKAALAIYRDIDNPMGTAHCILSLGDVHMRRDEYEEAQTCYEEALAIYHDIGNPLGKANSIFGLGELQRLQTEFETARESFEEAQAIYHEIGNRMSEANCIKSLGNVHLDLDEYEKAQIRYREAEAIYRDIGDRLGEINCIRSLGYVHEALGDYPQAFRQYELALQAYDEIGSLRSAAWTICAIARLLAKLNKPDEAINRAEECVARYKVLPELALLANGYEDVGNVYSFLKRYTEAAEAYGQAIKLTPSPKQQAKLYCNQCSAYADALQLEAAQQALAAARRLWPDYFYLPLRGAELYALLGDGRRALADADTVLKCDGVPKKYAWLLRAQALLLLGDQAVALEAVDNAIALTHTRFDLETYIDCIERFASLHPDVASILAVVQRLTDALHRLP